MFRMGKGQDAVFTALQMCHGAPACNSACICTIKIGMLTIRGQPLRKLRLKRLPSFPMQSAMSLAGTLGARAIAALGGFALSYWLAQAGGAAGLGQFTYVQSIIVILALIARLGTDHSLLRLVATLNDAGRAGAAGRYYLAGLAMTFAVGVVIAALAVPVARTGLLRQDEIALLGFLSWALPPLMLLNITSGYLRGHRMVALGMLIDVGTISGLTALVAWSVNERSVLQIAVLFVWVTSAMALVMSAWAIVLAHRRCGGVWLEFPPAGVPTMRAFLLGGWPFTVIAVAVYATQPGSFALGGPALDDRTLGLLRAAERLAILIGFALTAINPFIAPRVAAAYGARGIVGIQGVYRRVVLLSIAAAAPVALVITIFGEQLLRLLGSEFERAYPFLLIMAAAQFVQACFGSSNVVLTMAGREREAMRISVITIVFACVLFPVLSMYYEGYGFATSYLLVVLIKEFLTYKRVARFKQQYQ